MHRFAQTAAAAALFMATAIPQAGGQQLPPPEATDPVSLGTMAGFPPPPEKRVTLANVLNYPNARWAYHHMREVKPTKAVFRGNSVPSDFETALTDIEGVVFANGEGEETTIADWQRKTYTDALLVLHRGRIVVENYHAGMRPNEQHALWSMSKSFTGLLTAMLIHDGLIDADAPVSKYVPELEDSAWGTATVRQTLDMTTGAAYTEIFTDPKSGIFQYLLAARLLVPPPDYPGPATLYDYLPVIKQNGSHGDRFIYKTVDTEVLGWVLRRVTGKSLDRLMEERIWNLLGAEADAYYMLDPIGTEIASIGLNATLRDIGRFGEMLRLGGRFNGTGIVPSEVIEDIRKGGDQEKFKGAGQEARAGYSYHNQWWIPHDTDGSFEAKGFSGQHIHINPAAELVIVKFSSHPVGQTLFTHDIDRAAFKAIADTLRN